jgi:hypothetical protein
MQYSSPQFKKLLNMLLAQSTSLDGAKSEGLGIIAKFHLQSSARLRQIELRKRDPNWDQHSKPEVDTRLEAFHDGRTRLVCFVNELPRQQLEQTFLLRKTWERERRQNYPQGSGPSMGNRSKAELVKNVKTRESKMAPERQSQVLVTQAKTISATRGPR